MDETFSKEFKDVIAKSREIALSLGYDYISTLHLFLADCVINNAHSIRKFAFETEEAFQTFYDKHKVGEPILLKADLLLTKEAEKGIRKAFKLWSHSNYFDNEIRPYHLFLGASLLYKTSFKSIFPQEPDLYESLEKYYISNGQIQTIDIRKSFWMRHRKLLKWISQN